MRSDFCHTCFADLSPGEICPRCGEGGSSVDVTGDVLRPGSVLGGKFKIGRLLGRGGFGATYLSWDINLRVRVAIKEFLPRQLAARVPGETQVSAYTGDEDAFKIGLDQFLREASNLAQFRGNPGIISVLDFFPENGTGYMVMEFLDGRTLEQFVTERGPLAVSTALDLIVPVADALRACHAVGLIHRDVSPDNIFLTSDRRVKLLDFGAARFAIGQRSTNLSVILKEGYAPFEQYQRNGRQGPWTDIYALTATLYRLLTGDLPTIAPDRVGGVPLVPVSQKGIAISPQLQALLDKGMAIQPERRYQAVEAFLADLLAIPGTSPKRPWWLFAWWARKDRRAKTPADGAPRQPIENGSGKQKPWIFRLPVWQRLALVGGPVVLIVLLFAVPQPPPLPESPACDKASIQRVSADTDVSQLWRIAELCASENKLDLRFEAVETCAQRDYGQCLMTMARWYDPGQGSEPTPFSKRSAVLATQYYRRAQNHGVEDARGPLDALCGSLLKRGEAAEASC
jgi:serine/threonine protein kinase